MSITLTSPVSRMGGKYYLRNWLADMIPKHTLYCEPFCGAGHLLFSKTPSPVEVINDIDGCLIEFFKTIQHPEKRQILIDRLNYMPYSRALWLDIRTQWKQGDLPTNDIERVSQWFYLNRTCFSGDQKHGGFAVPSVTGRNPIISFRNTVDSLNIVAKRLKNVCIENLPYQECIKRYQSEDTLVYADPPYWNAEKFYGKDCFTQDDHYKLAELLRNNKGKIMVSHYANPVYDGLYKGWNRYEYASFKGSHKAAPGTEKPVTVECLYANFEPIKTRGLFNENILV